MKNFLLISLIIIGGGTSYLYFNPQHPLSQKVLSIMGMETITREVSQIANPASVFCEQNSGTLEIKTDLSGGQSGLCHLTGGEICEEWSYMRGECPVAVAKEEILSGNEQKEDNSSYTKDDNSVYFHGKIITGADPIIFEVLKETNDEYAKDKNNVYYFASLCEVNCNNNHPSILEGADPETFEALKGTNGEYDHYAKDKNNVYQQGSILKGADPKTFEALIDQYSKDQNNVYFFFSKLEGPDPTTVEIMNRDYFKDKNNVYFLQTTPRIKINVLLGADTGTFETFPGGYAKDKNSIYLNGKKTEKDIPEIFLRK